MRQYFLVERVVVTCQKVFSSTQNPEHGVWGILGGKTASGKKYTSFEIEKIRNDV